MIALDSFYDNSWEIKMLLSGLFKKFTVNFDIIL
jgi:hypothetical protein